VRDRGHHARGGRHQHDGEHSYRAGVPEECRRRGRDRGVVDEQRKQPEQHHLRLQGDVGHEGQESDDQPGHDQHDGGRYAGAAQRGHGEQGGRRDAQDDE
jgi:hypothetical protein